jgi:hypothetical protein
VLAHEVGVQELRKADTLNADQLAHAMKNVDRSVDTK